MSKYIIYKYIYTKYNIQIQQYNTNTKYYKMQDMEQGTKYKNTTCRNTKRANQSNINTNQVLQKYNMTRTGALHSYTNITPTVCGKITKQSHTRIIHTKRIHTQHKY